MRNENLIMTQLSLKRFGFNMPSTEETFKIHEKISIGRNPQSDIPIKSNKVSRNHCLIWTDQDGKVFALDLNSHNGTYVNNTKISKIQVYPNDVLQIGAEKFQFVHAIYDSSSDDSFTRKKSKPRSTIVSDEERSTQKPLKLKGIIENNTINKRIKSIVIKSVESNQKEFHLPVNSAYRIGRMPFNDIFLDDKSISRVHAKIDIRENHVEINDEGSTNGILVNGKMITHTELEDKNTIELGKKKFIVKFIMDSKSIFSSLEKIDHLTTIDLMRDQDLVLKILKREYGEKVLIEAERQTLLFYQEFMNHLKYSNTVNSDINIVENIVHLFIPELEIIDTSTSKMLICRTSVVNMIRSHYLPQVKKMVHNKNEKIVYFEEIDPNNPMGVKMNGFALNLHGRKKIMAFGVPLASLLYLVYASNQLLERNAEASCGTKAEELAKHTQGLSDFTIATDVGSDYGNMGALIIDGILKAGIANKTVVKPRINKYLEEYSRIVTTSQFRELIGNQDIATIINWELSSKTKRIEALACCLSDNAIETEPEFSEWLEGEENVAKLLRIPGMDQKTIDYFKKMAGHSTTTTDRYLLGFIRKAGIDISSDEEAQIIISETSRILGIEEKYYDYSIWKYMLSIPPPNH